MKFNSGQVVFHKIHRIYAKVDKNQKDLYFGGVRINIFGSKTMVIGYEEFLEVDSSFEEYWNKHGIKTNPAIMSLAFKEVAEKAWYISRGQITKELK